MSTNPAFLKGLFGPPDDDPLLSPTPNGDDSCHRRPADIDTTADRSAANDDAPATKNNADADESADAPAAAPPSLYARIQDVMQKTTGVGTPNTDTEARSDAPSTPVGGDGRASGAPAMEPAAPSSMFDFADGDP